MWTLSIFVPVLATLAYRLNSLRNNEAERRKSKPRVTDIRIYPIKSCHGISLKTGKIAQLGFEYDREWMLVDANTHRFISQRQSLGSLATVIPSFIGDYLCVDAPKMNTLKIPLETSKSKGLVSVQIWDDTLMATDEGDIAAAWFSKFLGRDVRLVRINPKYKRIADPKFWTEDISGSKIVSFADGFPFLLCSKESLASLNSNIPADQNVPLTRFRPNIIVEGAQVAYDEDKWFTFTIRGVTFHGIKPCGRCKVTTIDQDSGESHNSEPLATIQRLRPHANGAIFGQNVVHETAGYICVGDTVDVLERKDM